MTVYTRHVYYDRTINIYGKKYELVIVPVVVYNIRCFAFYFKNILNVFLHSNVFVDKMNCNYVLAEIPFQPPPLKKVWFKKSSILKGFVLNEYK